MVRARVNTSEDFLLCSHPFNITPSYNDPTLVISSVVHQSQTDIPSISLYHASVLQQHPFNITPSYISHPFNITPSYNDPTLVISSVVHQTQTDIPSISLHHASVLHRHPFNITPSYISHPFNITPSYVSPTLTSLQHHSILHQSYTDIPSKSLHPTSVLHRHPFNITPSYISPTPTSLQHHSILHQSYTDIPSTSLHPTAVVHNPSPQVLPTAASVIQRHSVLPPTNTTFSFRLGGQPVAASRPIRCRRCRC